MIRRDLVGKVLAFFLVIRGPECPEGSNLDDDPNLKNVGPVFEFFEGRFGFLSSQGS